MSLTFRRIRTLLNTDPLLVDPGKQDLHLGPKSPAVDAGTLIPTPCAARSARSVNLLTAPWYRQPIDTFDGCGRRSL